MSARICKVPECKKHCWSNYDYCLVHAEFQRTPIQRYNGTREDCAAWLRTRGFRCGGGLAGWYKPGILAAIYHRAGADDFIGEVQEWDNDAFQAAYWPSTAAPTEWRR